MRGIAEIHKKCILHRDLKPENIFIGEKEGRFVAKIGDFGLAWMLRDNCQKNMCKSDKVDIRRSTTSRSSLTGRQSLFSSVAGTEVYMAPEIRTHYREGT